MQVQVKQLRDAFKLLEPVVPKKTELPILTNVLIKDGKVIGGDMQTFVMVDLPEADIEFLAPHNAVTQLLEFIPGSEVITVEVNKELILSWEGGKASYPVARVKDYPEILEIKPAVQGEADGVALMKALSDIVGYSATESERPVLTGVIFFPGEKLDVAAGDGFRMAYQTIPVSFPIEEPLIIPRESVSILDYIWRHTSNESVEGNTLVERVLSKRKIELTLAQDGGMPDKLQLRFGKITVIAKLIAGTPPDFKKLVPEDPPIKVQLFPQDLERAIKRLKTVAKDGSGIVRLVWTKDTMTVSARSEEMGKIEGELPVQANNPERVGLSFSYLLKYLKGKEGLITMGFTQKGNPVIFRHRLSPLVIIMPMNVDW